MFQELSLKETVAAEEAEGAMSLCEEVSESECVNQQITSSMNQQTNQNKSLDENLLNQKNTGKNLLIPS